MTNTGKRSLDNSLSIKDRMYKVQDVPGDGNCFFHCLSLCLFGDISRSKELKRKVCLHIASEWDSFKDRMALYHDEKFANTERYLSKMIERNGWVTALEVRVASEMLGLQLRIYTQGTKLHVVTKRHVTVYTESVLQPTTANTNHCIDLLLSNGHYRLLTESDSGDSIYHSKAKQARCSRDKRSYSEVLKSTQETTLSLQI